MTNLPPTVMPIDPPTGYLTRPEAAKQFNRSQRALERDLDLALGMQDREVLQYWRLATKDGKVFDATEMSVERVKALVADGMSPTWYVEERWLETEYGRKGTPVKRRQQKATSPLPERQDDRDAVASNSSNDTGWEVQRLRDENAFLRDRVQSLEQERSADAERSERREAKLFAQLEVKDKQISAWDEITQGLTRGLATGQLAPQLRSATEEPPLQSSPGAPTKQAVVIEKAARENKVPSTTTAKKASGKGKPKRSNSTKGRKSPSKTRKPQSRQPSTAAEQPKWYEMPTIKGLLSRK